MTTNTDPTSGHHPLTSSQQQITPYFPSSSCPSLDHHQNPRKKQRSKFIKIESEQPGATPVPKRKYTKKQPDPIAPKITKPCSECGKKFSSWKALFGHMRCHPERQWRGINPPPNFRRRPTDHPPDDDNALFVMTEEDHEVAACLLMLAGGGNVEIECGTSYQLAAAVEDDLNNCRFKCSSCNKEFGSHQALGGHRASHKNVKGCFAITKSCGGGDGSSEVEDHSCCEYGDGLGPPEDHRNKMMVVMGNHHHHHHHQCSICLRVFSSGQALGGHKRCHWEKGDEQEESHHHQGLHNGCCLDLNLPAPVEDNSSSSHYSSALTLDLRLGL